MTVSGGGAKKVLARVNVEIVKRSDRANGFLVLPKRWIVERTLAGFGRCRVLAGDWECLYDKPQPPPSSASSSFASCCENYAIPKNDPGTDSYAHPPTRGANLGPRNPTKRGPFSFSLRSHRSAIVRAMPDDNLKPSESDDLAESIAFALCFKRQKAGGMTETFTARIAADGSCGIWSALATWS